MNKRFSLTLFAMMVLFAGCSYTNYREATSADVARTLINSTTIDPQSKDTLGICVSLSHRSSLNVDVKGIIDYFKGTAVVESLGHQQTIREPWVCYSATF